MELGPTPRVDLAAGETPSGLSPRGKLLSKMSELGRLERVDLRNIWKTEAQDFTPWLASEENLSVLADTLGMELELEAQEANVGPFRADILCKNTVGGAWVLIENQLEPTDHSHLGQLLTYAAGLHAVTICWVAESFTEEHRATLDWLNEITDDKKSNESWAGSNGERYRAERAAWSACGGRRTQCNERTGPIRSTGSCRPWRASTRPSDRA